MGDLRKVFPSGPIVVCDFYVEGIEKGQLSDSGFSLQEVENIDHHAPASMMMTYISSGVLAIRQVNRYGSVPPNVPVVINHMDCDSVLSSLIARGHLPPLDVFGQAVLDADHFGDENPIADLLQSLDKKRNINFSARNLGLLLTGQPLDPEASELLSIRLAERELARTVKENREYKQFGKVVLVEPTQRISGEFLPPLFPDAIVIASAIPFDADSGKFEIKLRLGKAAPPGMSLLNLEIDSFDPNFGGRWNAGSNNRSGGTLIQPEEYAQKLNILLQAF